MTPLCFTLTRSQSSTALGIYNLYSAHRTHTEDRGVDAGRTRPTPPVSDSHTPAQKKNRRTFRYSRMAFNIDKTQQSLLPNPRIHEASTQTNASIKSNWQLIKARYGQPDHSTAKKTTIRLYTFIEIYTVTVILHLLQFTL